MKTARVNMVGAFVLSMSVLGLSGCAVSADEEEVGNAEQAFGEATCGTISPNVTDPTVFNSGTISYNHSGSSTYGNPFSCSHGFIVQYTNNPLGWSRASHHVERW